MAVMFDTILGELREADKATAAAAAAEQARDEAVAAKNIAATSATQARTWAEGSDADVQALGGEHSAKTYSQYTEATYQSFIAAAAEYYVGPASAYGVTVDGTLLSFTWTDPADNNVVKWAKTRLVMKTGGFPENENDGTVLLDSTVRNQHQSVPFTWDAGVVSNYYFGLFTQSTGGAWNTGNDSPRFTTDLLTWTTIAMMSRAGTLMQYPGMAIGGVSPVPMSEGFPKCRYKLLHMDYTGVYPTVSAFMVDNTINHNSIWGPDYLPCYGSNNDAWQFAYDMSENSYGRNSDEAFMQGRSYWKFADDAYVQLVQGTDYSNGDSCADWETTNGTPLYVKNNTKRVSYGYNNYLESGVKQRLNGKNTGWWTPKNPFDVGYGDAAIGFRTGMLSDFEVHIQQVRIRTAMNTTAVASWGAGGGYADSVESIWLPSSMEVFRSKTNNIAEGYQLDYWKNVAVTNASRIQRDEGGTARNTWLRSPATGYVDSAANIGTSGTLNANSLHVDFSCAVLPLVCLA